MFAQAKSIWRRAGGLLASSLLCLACSERLHCKDRPAELHADALGVQSPKACGFIAKKGWRLSQIEVPRGPCRMHLGRAREQDQS